MTDSATLLSYVAQRHTSGLEDVATDALCFILSHSASARSALSAFLGDERDPLPVEKAQPWAAVAHGAEPDLACYNRDGTVVAFVEAKFWAPLTHHQPVTYWEELPSDRPAVLLFLAPDYRIDQGSLWGELVDRLHKKGHELGTPDRCKGLVTASAKVGQRRLMLASWHTLLDRMAGRAKEDGDSQTCFEIAELKGLANEVIEGDNPKRDENRRKLIDEAVERLKQLGWANTERLTTGESRGVYFARYLRLAGASAGLRIDYEILKQEPERPLWLWFWKDPDARVGVEEIGRILSGSDEPDVEWRSGDVFTPISLPVDADRQATLDAIVEELERIAALIDPNGPTYPKSTPIARVSRPTTQLEPWRSTEGRGQGRPPIKVMCWNVAKRHDPWRELVEMDADVALLQEVGTVPEDVLDRVDLSPHTPWLKYDPTTGNEHYDRWPMVVRLSDRVSVEWFRQIGPVGETRSGDVAVSGIGTIEVARVVPKAGPESFIAASMYARWLGPHPTAVGDWTYSDASAHNIISDLTAFIGYYDRPDKHRILAAGDLNIGFWSSDQFDHRAQTVMDRFHSLGLDYMGPQYPAGRQAYPIPEHLDEKSLDVPTYHTTRSDPAGAQVQIDHVFASRGFHEEVQARALNEVSEWGPSDHCRLAIDVG